MKTSPTLLTIFALMMIFQKAPADGIGAQEDALVFTLRGVKTNEHALPRKYLHFRVNSKDDAENKLDIKSLVRNTEKNPVDSATSHVQEATSNGSNSTNGDAANNNGNATDFRPSSISVDNSHRRPCIGLLFRVIRTMVMDLVTSS
uniref:Uncharacterized protein n=1 Tax=Ananas comosus var. bracteatus TaxID=296719 RepID=A0A6V7QKY1_ANACO|nr:unnamed protein product [Ananas comosus var. bracteatus]